jgi:hypothetical protein
MYLHGAIARMESYDLDPLDSLPCRPAHPCLKAMHYPMASRNAAPPQAPVESMLVRKQ